MEKRNLLTRFGPKNGAFPTSYQSNGTCRSVCRGQVDFHALPEIVLLEKKYGDLFDNGKEGGRIDPQPENKDENGAAGQADGKIGSGDRQFPEGGTQIERDQHLEIEIDGDANCDDADDRQDNEVGLEDGPK